MLLLYASIPLRNAAWYVDEDDPECITDDGIEKFCSDLSIDTQDVAILLIAWKMDAENMCVFTFDEWEKGLTVMG